MCKAEEPLLAMPGTKHPKGSGYKASMIPCYAKRPASHSYYIAFGDSVLLRLIKSIPSVTAYLHAAAKYTCYAKRPASHSYYIAFNDSCHYD